MKKLIALLLALTMVLALAACGGEKKDKDHEPEKNTKPTTEATAEPTTEPTVEPTTEPTVAPTTEPATEPATEPQVEETLQGIQDGNTYTNSLLGLTFTAPEGWGLADNSQLAQILGMSADALTPENFQRTLDTAGVAMILYAASADGLVNVNVVLENLARSNAQDITEEQYVQATKDIVIATMENAGAENLEYESGALSFAGAAHYAVAMQGTIGGVDLYEAQVYIKCGDYMACFTVASYGENHVEEVLAMFEGI
jgi:hypothetical protein